MRGIRVIRGKHAELLLAEPSDDFVKAVLSDEVPIIDAMKRLREVFPNACDLSYDRDERAPDTKTFIARVGKAADPLDVIGDFLAQVRGDGLGDQELAVVAEAISDVRGEERAE